MSGRRLSNLGLILGLALFALLPAAAQGAEAPPEGLAIFTVPASHGYELMLHAAQARPGSKTELWVQVDELRDELEITRGIEAVAGPDALRFSPTLTTATLAPPAPFHGHASFKAHAPRAKRWSGNLSVDLPGYSDYPLVGPGIHAELERPRA